MSLAWSLRLVSFLVIAAAAPSQNTIVSPVIATSVEGASNNVYPWANNVVRRYQQIHGDIGGTPKLIQKLSWRLNAATTLYTGTRAIDVEVFMGFGKPVSQTSFFFAQNYIGSPIRVVARKTINMGPQGQAVSPGPNPFTSNMDLVLDTPFPYPASTSLVWEAVVYSNTLTGTFGAMDAEISSTTTGATTITGPGCGAMTQNPSYTDCAGILVANFQLTGGPANAPTLLAIGSSNPSVSVPGLCSGIYTNFLLIIPIGVTDATGAITAAMTGASTFVLPNTIAGGTVYTQVHSLDATQPGIPIANSNGRSGVMPTSNLSKVVDVARIWNDTGGTTAVEGQFFATLTIAYGLVTQFTY